jgi:hypothetical protein
VSDETNKLTPALKQGVYSRMTLLPGEDLATYDDFLGRVYAAIKPIDVIDEIFIDDVASLEWEILRWRRLKSELIRACAYKSLERFLRKHLDYGQYWKFFEEDLTESLQGNDTLTKDLQGNLVLTKDIARPLAQQCARNEPGAVDKVNRLLTGISVDDILESAQARKAEELAQKYRQGKRGAVNLVDKLLASAGSSIDAITADALSRELDNIERMDRLATIAENRRNAVLREIDRRRVVLGQTLRRRLPELEGELNVIEKAPPDAKRAA